MSALQQIKEIIKKGTPRTFFIKVRNANTGQIIATADRKELQEKDGLDNYLKWLHQTKGVTEIVIDPRRSNGTRDIRIAEEARLKIGGSTPQTMATETTTQNPVAHQATPLPELMGGQIGLGQYMEAHSSMRALQKMEQDHAELKMKFETLQAEKERWKDDCIEQKRINDRLEDKIERKSPLDGININEALPVLVSLLKPQAPAQGLNAPAQKQLSPIKEALRQSIEAEGMPDEIIEKLYKILENYVGNNEKFINQFEALVNQTNLKKVKDA